MLEKRTFLLLLFNLLVIFNCGAGDGDFLSQYISDIRSGPTSENSSCSGESKTDGSYCSISPVALMDGNKLREFNFNISLMNDAFPHMLGLQPDWILKQSPNDMGLTHGFSFSSSVKIDGWNVVQLKLDKKLFTGHDEEKNGRNGLSGDMAVEQKSTTLIFESSFLLKSLYIQ